MTKRIEKLLAKENPVKVKGDAQTKGQAIRETWTEILEALSELGYTQTEVIRTGYYRIHRFVHEGRKEALTASLVTFAPIPSQQVQGVRSSLKIVVETDWVRTKALRT